MTLEEKVKRLNGTDIVKYKAPDGTVFFSCRIKGKLTVVLEGNPTITPYSLHNGIYPDVYKWVDDNGKVVRVDNMDVIDNLKGSKGALYASCIVYSYLSSLGETHDDIKPRIIKVLLKTSLWVNRKRAMSAASKLYRGIKRYGFDGSIRNMTPLQLFDMSYQTGAYIKTGWSGSVRLTGKRGPYNTKNDKTIQEEIMFKEIVDTTTSLNDIAKGDIPFFTYGDNTIKKYDGAESVIINKDGTFIVHCDGIVDIDNVTFTAEDAIKMAGI